MDEYPFDSPLPTEGDANVFIRTLDDALDARIRWRDPTDNEGWYPAS